jgi:hypothetical protein
MRYFLKSYQLYAGFHGSKHSITGHLNRQIVNSFQNYSNILDFRPQMSEVINNNFLKLGINGVFG